jgi:hypothetical protein
MDTHPKRSIPTALAAAAGLLLAACLLLAGWAAATLLHNPFLAFSRTASGPVVLQQIQQLNRLETCRYNGEVVVRGEKKGLLPTWLSGDRELLVGRGEVVAGLDLSTLRAQDIHVKGHALTVRLPAPQILHTRLDNRRSVVHERTSGILSGPDRELDGQVRAEAEEKIRAAALESGILRTAETNARETLGRQLRQFGFQEVRFL